MAWRVTEGVKTEEVNDANAKFRQNLLAIGLIAIGIAALMLNARNGNGLWVGLGGALAVWGAGKISAKRRLDPATGKMKDITWW